MDPQKHIEAAEKYMKFADGTEDMEWALHQIELAKVHIMTACIKLAMNVLDGNSRPGTGIGRLINLVK